MDMGCRRHKPVALSMLPGVLPLPRRPCGQAFTIGLIA